MTIDAPAASSTPAPPAPALPATPRSTWLRRFGPWLVVLAGALAYGNSLTAPFVLDDLQIRDNPAVATLFGPIDWLGLEARPITLVSLRINHAIDRALGGDGLRTPVYHATNVLIHLAAALMLYALVLASSRRSPEAPGSPHGLATVVALLWVVHPLTTQAVTYTIQRGESLASLFILLALVALACGAGAARRRGTWAWYGAAVAAAWLGLLSKQVAVVIPVLALLYDRAFLTEGLADVLRRRWRLYLLLLTPTIALATCLLLTSNEPAAPATQASAGFALEKHTAWQYALTQPRAVVQYLRLAIVPHPLVFDYGWSAFTSLREAWPWLVAVVAAGLATLVALGRWPRVGFIAAAFFVVLGPSSSVLPIADVVYEYRAYLALSSVLTGVVLAAAWALPRVAGRAWPTVAVVLVGVAAVALGSLTVLRNRDYASAERLWLDTAAKAPDNPRAHHNLANVYLEQGRYAEALPAYRRALELEPRNALARTNLAVALRETGEPDAAQAQLFEALRAYPGFGPTMYQIGVTARELGRLDEAEAWLSRATGADPHNAAAWFDLGTVRYERGDREAGVAAWRRAAELGLRSAPLFNNLGLAAAQAGDLPAAARWWEASLQLNPNQPDTRANLERARGMLGR